MPRSTGIAALWWLALAVAPSAAGPAAAAPHAAVLGSMTITGRNDKAIDPAGAIVWLEPEAGGPASPAPAPERAVIDMRGKAFLPAVVAVPVGSSVAFPNGDPILHNVFSVSAGNRFDLGLYARGEGREVVFREPGVVRVFCNVHPQMEAFVVVTPTRWRAAVAADGTFSIDGVPEGRYTVQAWDPRGGSATYPVELTAGSTSRVDVRLDASGYRRRPHLDKNGRPYADRDRY